MKKMENMEAIYQRRAKHYDITANLFYVIGFRVWAYRKSAVATLNLRIGDTVVEIGCGTGLNFPLLQKVIGPTGTIIGVDMSEAMLEQARVRTKNQDWTNVKLVQSDAASFNFPENLAGVLATFSLKAMPDYDTIIAKVSSVLPANKRLVVLDLQRPDWCPNWLRELVIRLLGPFGANDENANNQPWHAMKRSFATTNKITRYAGVAFIGYGENLKQ